MVQLYFYDAETERDIPEEEVARFPTLYRDRWHAAKVETVRRQAEGSARLLREHFGVTSDEQLLRGEHGALSVKG
ncbi:MAG: hypothetical protein J5847_03205, partial [Clostridia bacterium]|nr:hypothetical protein [Clostridia bacterium]